MNALCKDIKLFYQGLAIITGVGLLTGQLTESFALIVDGFINHQLLGFFLILGGLFSIFINNKIIFIIGVSIPICVYSALVGKAWLLGASASITGFSNYLFIALSSGILVNKLYERNNQ